MLDQLKEVTTVSVSLHGQGPLALKVRRNHLSTRYNMSQYSDLFCLHQCMGLKRIDWSLCISLDVDECVNSPCPQGSVCVNTGGSFSCECDLGFDLEDGRSCTQGTWSVFENKIISRVASTLIITLCFGFTLQSRHFWALLPSTTLFISEIQVCMSCTERSNSWYAIIGCILQYKLS